MKAPHPWLGQSPEIVSGIHHRKIGKARLLFDFYTARQTHPDGSVNYGRPMTYDWIRGQILECPSRSTFKRHNRALKKGGYIRTETIIQNRVNVGFTVMIVNQTKFRTGPKRITGEQLGLLNQPLRMPAPPRASENPAENKKISAQGVGSDLTPGGVKSEPEKAVILKTSETYTSNTRAQIPRATSQPALAGKNQTDAHALASEALAWRRQQKQRRIIGDIERLREIYVGAQDPAMLARRDIRLNALYDELRECGGLDETEARAG